MCVWVWMCACVCGGHPFFNTFERERLLYLDLDVFCLFLCVFVSSVNVWVKIGATNTSVQKLTRTASKQGNSSSSSSASTCTHACSNEHVLFCLEFNSFPYLKWAPKRWNYFLSLFSSFTALDFEAEMGLNGGLRCQPLEMIQCLVQLPSEQDHMRPSQLTKWMNLSYRFSYWYC